MKSQQKAGKADFFLKGALISVFLFVFVGLFSASSEAEGLLGYYNLGTPQTVLVQDESWEATPPHTLSVVEPNSSGYTYWGYYGLQDDCGGVGLVRSNDLVNWTKYSGNPLFLNGRWPSVLKVGDTFYMLYTKDYCTNSYIKLSTSIDGINFTDIKTIVKKQSGYCNQNPNLFYNPNDGKYYIYWYNGDDAQYFTIRARSAATIEGLDDPSSETIVLQSNSVLAAPNMLFYDNTYFLSTESWNSNMGWEVQVYASTSPTSGFSLLPGNPVLTNGSACMFQHVFGNDLHEYYCKFTSNWTVGHRLADLTKGRLQYYTVTPSVVGSGSVTPSTPQTVNYGSTTSFTLTPNTGYHIDSVTGTCGGTLSGNRYTTASITGNCTVVATFAINTYTVTPVVVGSGSINPSNPQTVNHVSTASFTLTPNTGYHIDSVTGTCGGTLSGNNYTTASITKDCTVVATFAINTYTVTPVVVGSGSINPSNPQTVNHVSTTSFTLTPNTGYHIDSVTGTCGGTLSGYTYTTAAITADCSVIANFAINTYTVTPSVVGSGSIDPSTPQPVNYESTTSFTLLPNTGYHIDSVTGTCGGTLAENTYTTAPITEDCSVIVTFEINKYAITAITGKHIGITCIPDPVNYEGDSECTVQPEQGYYVDTLLVDGSPATLTNGEYTFENVISNHTIAAVVAPYTEVILLAPVDGETILSGSNYTITWGAPANAVKFKLEYSMDNGLTWALIKKDIPAASYDWTDWTVPTPWGNKKGCVIRVTGYDALNREIGRDKAVALVIEVVKVTYPNGGEAFAPSDPGDPHPLTITWTTNATKRDVAKVKLIYTKDGGLTWIPIITLNDPASIATGSHSYDWTVPTMIGNKRQCKIRVELIDADGNVLGRDASGSYFTIEVVKVTSPNGGPPPLTSGSIVPITWTTNATKRPVAKVRLYYTKNGGVTWNPICDPLTGKCALPGNPGSYEWIVPAVIKTKNNCKVRVELRDASGNILGADTSDDYFPIEVVRVESPNGGEPPLTPGNIQPITWTTNATKNDVAKVKLFYTQNGGVTWNPICDPLTGKCALPGNPGSYDWIVPAVIKTKNNCKVRVVLIDAAGNILGQDASDECFTIQP